MLVVAPPPVRGLGSAGGFRMMVEDKSGAGPAALQAAVNAMMGKAAQTPGVRQVFSLFETSTPQLYLDIDRVKAQMLGINIPDVFAALQIVSRLALRQRLQYPRAHVPRYGAVRWRLSTDAEGCAQHPCPQCKRRCRSAGVVHDGQRYLRTVACSALQPLSGRRARWVRRARIFAGPGHRYHAEDGR